MTAPPRPRIRHCPVCGIAMQGGKTLEDRVEFDTFECLTCKTSVREAKRRPPAGNGKS